MYKFCLVPLFLIFSFHAFSENIILNWGVFNVRLNQVSVNTYVGYMEVTRSQAISMARTDFVLLKDNLSRKSWKESHLYIRETNGMMVEFPLNPGVNKLNNSDFGNFMSALDVQDVLVVSMCDHEGVTYVASFSILADQPDYHPPFYVSPYSRIHRFPYQLVTSSEGKSQILKLDTTLAENKKVMDAYLKMPRVSIQHYPKFETVSNYLSANDTIIQLGKRNFEIHPINKPVDDLLLITTEPKEIVDAADMYLDWNKMIVKPDGPVFSLAFLKNIQSHSISFFANDKKYEIQSMRFTYLDGKKLNKGYYWKNTMTYPIEPIRDLNNPFSILIDRVIIKDARLGYVYIPQIFLFSFQ